MPKNIILDIVIGVSGGILFCLVNIILRKLADKYIRERNKD